ncbi:MAG: SCP2 sterol-binding domain-containing protein [Thermodesulfobacteriota bacterium]
MSFSVPQEAFDAMIQRFVPDAAEGVDAVFQWEVVGDGGGKWHIVVKDKKAELFQGKHASPGVAQLCSTDTFLGLVNYEINGMQAFMSGKLKVTGDLMLAQKIMEIFPLD